ncbi:DM13 domain-containing protein [Kitasatospora sp. NPDC004240]
MLNRVPVLGRLPRRVLAGVITVVLAVAVAGLYLFEPWKAFTNTTVDEALPGPVVAAPVTPSPDPSTPRSAPTPATPVQAGPVDLARGGFVSGEHETTGTARLLRLPDGTSVLRLEDLRTSEGPDVRVYLSTRPASESRLDTLGDGAVELAPLKGNRGNQNYTVPAGTDLSKVRSAVIWCHRFSVGFGAADLTATTG